MPISHAHIATATAAYLQTYPQQATALTRLTAALKASGDITRRKNFTGHVTASAAIATPAGLMLFIHHTTLNKLLLPGGHLEPSDHTLAGAARREAIEETGIDPGKLTLWTDRPIHIDVHPIPAHDGKNEPAHWHYDLTYAFGTPNTCATLTPQYEEVTQVTWLTAHDDYSHHIAARLRHAASRAGERIHPHTGH